MTDNIFDIQSIPTKGEIQEDITRYNNVVIKRIVSSESLQQETFCQDEAEWVVLLKGSAELWMGDTRHQLAAGDYLFIPALQKHTLTKVEKGTLWLAIHIYEKDIA